MIETFPSNVSHIPLIRRCFLCIRIQIGMKKFFEKIIEGVLTCSGFVTSITILLIVLFLFTEAFGLFKSKVIEEGYVLALNKSNKVSVLTPAQIKNVFDEEITNWKELGGKDLPIREAKNCDALEAMKDIINPDSLKVLPNCYIEKFAATLPPLSYLQFQRIGYFNIDKDSTPEKLIFNRTVGLKDTWGKINK